MASRHAMNERSEAAFDRIVRENSQPVRRYALHLLRDPWLADDAMQETFLRAWKYWPSSDVSENVQAWLIRIRRNVSFDMMSRRVETAGLREANLVAFGSTTMRHDLTALLNMLSLEHREVLYLVDVLGYDYATVAEALEVKMGTVRSRLNRARSALREIVGDLAKADEQSA